MRYYNIVITDPVTGAPIMPSSLGGMNVTSLLPGGGANVAALNVELDIPVAAQHLPNGNALVRIWGLGLKDIGGSFNLNPGPQNTPPGALVSVYGGMSKGLPLANPTQQGLLVAGQVIQAFGNWLGLEQTVDLILTTPSSGSSSNPVNYVLNWQSGTTLASALKTTFSIALPKATQRISISPRLTLPYAQPAYYESLTQLSTAIYGLSRSIITDPSYMGVTIVYDGQTVTVSDGTVPATDNITVNFQDLLGQPTWIQPQIIQIKTVMRGDIDLLNTVTLPAGLSTVTANAMVPLASTQQPANNLTFSGPYTVLNIHHYGNFRQADALSWNTTINMTPVVPT